MKIFNTINAIILLFSFNSFAQDLSFEKTLQEMENKRLRERDGTIEKPVVDSTKELTGLEKDKGRVTKTPEGSFFYLSLGKPLFTFNGEKEFGSSFSLGHKRDADSFIYGLEFNYSKINDVLDIKDVSAMIGFQTIWRHRFQPYATLSFGNSWASVKPTSKNYTGYKNSLDLGINLNPYALVKFFSGMRYNHYNFSDKEIRLSSQEFYLTIGIEF